MAYIDALHLELSSRFLPILFDAVKNLGQTLAGSYRVDTRTLKRAPYATHLKDCERRAVARLVPRPRPGRRPITYSPRTVKRRRTAFVDSSYHSADKRV